MGPGNPATSLRNDFGMTPTLRGAASSLRRRAAADIFHQSPESFRKSTEQALLKELAEQILRLIRKSYVEHQLLGGSETMSLISDAIDAITGVPGSIAESVVLLGVDDLSSRVWERLKKALFASGDLSPETTAQVSDAVPGSSIAVDDLIRILSSLSDSVLKDALEQEAAQPRSVSIANASDNSSVWVGGDIAGGDITKHA